MARSLEQIPKCIISLSKEDGYVELFANGDRSLVERLLNHDDMKIVWSEIVIYEKLHPVVYIADGTEDEMVDHDFIVRKFFMTALLVRSQWERLSKVPSKLLKSECLDLAQQLGKISGRLKRMSPELQFLLGLPLDTILWSRQNNEHQAMLPEGRTLPEVLDYLSVQLKRSPGWKHINLRPTKPNESNAERTFCARVLADFFFENLRSQRADLVALATTAILDLTDPLTSEHAAKLFKDL